MLDVAVSALQNFSCSIRFLYTLLIMCIRNELKKKHFKRLERSLNPPHFVGQKSLNLTKYIIKEFNKKILIDKLLF